jgi:RimJ/RimL family protein N-acetyltransferase
MPGILLEPFAEKHLDAVASMLDDADSRRFTTVPVPPPPEFPRSWLARYEEGRENGSREAFAVLDDAGAVVGLVLAPRIDRKTQTVELGYVVAPEARGRGIATEALRRMTEWALAEGMLRLELKIDVGNDASKRVAQRCGYVFEGVLRSTYLKDGIRTDTEIWSRLPTDPG